MKKLAPIFIFLAGVLWGSMGIFVRVLNGKGLFSMEIVALRAIVTAIFMAVFLLFFHRDLLKIKWKDIWVFLGSGLGSILFFNFCYFRAISLTSLSIAAILLYTSPAIVMILSFFLFKEKFTGRKVLALVMTFLGCILVTGVLEETAAVTGKGVLAGLGAGLGYALYSIFSRYAIDKGYHSLTITCYTFVIAAVGSLFLSDRRQIAEAALGSPAMFAFSLVFGLICTVLPYLLYTAGLKYVENSRASIIVSVEPVAATLIGFFRYQEKIRPMGFAGIVLVLSAMVLCSVGKKEGAADSED